MLDRAIVEFDKIVKNLFHKPISKRNHPDEFIVEADLSEAEKAHIIGLMRVNHCGEICAQALYQGQALTARDQAHREAFDHAAYEEIEHLAWTEHRIKELGGKTSVLNPLFYAGSLAIGIGAGVLGDKWSLGFLEETEKQVESHLTEHLDKIPEHDNKSRAVLEQMREDEIRHAHMAHDSGAADLPAPIKNIMKITSKVMTSLSYKI
ncbi:MAG: 2-polyprenyl-3-methyl-6-methoxy-1,4-benzoquinone monooxygenase [Burkholderiales bacterium]|nr:2-polyprenyl-3-methyl-6-methoxy-1,4-benzoquinone monooxygenase [Burkholderiales bacterium]